MGSEETRDAGESVPKVRKTYGRKKDADSTIPVRVEDGCEGHAAINSRLRMSGNTAMDDSVGDRAASSRTTRRLFNIDEEGFGWKKKLAEIDGAFEDEESIDLSRKTHISRSLDGEEEVSEGLGVDQMDGMDDFERQVLGPSALFSSVLSRKKRTSSITTSTHPSAVNGVFNFDESSPEKGGHRLDSSPTSPAHPHPINTPNSRSSPTPPTSDLDMDTQPPKSSHSVSAALSDAGDASAADDEHRISSSAKGKSKEKAKTIKVRVPLSLHKTAGDKE